VAQAGEADELSAGLLTELQTEFAAARERPQAQSHADAVLDISLELAMPVEKVEAGLAALEAQPRVIRKVLMRRIAERRGWRDSARRTGDGGCNCNLHPPCRSSESGHG